MPSEEVSWPSLHFPGVGWGLTDGWSTDNQELRNLMMAWYWAGYYVGLHEGQQKAQQQQ